jgi:uncharacterized protein (TIGR02001 family)
MLTKTIAMAAALGAISSVAIAAEGDDVIPGDFTANVALATDYTFRGITQTDESPAIQGGFDWSMEAGPVTPYLGTWASNIDFNADETLELDLYGGIKAEVGPVGVDVGLIYYAYPGAGLDYEYLEAKLGLSVTPIEMLTLAGTYYYSPDYFFESGTSHYLNGTATIAPGLPLGISFTGSVGHQWIENNNQFGTPDYTDWSIGVSAVIEGFTVTASYVDTDLSDNECFGGSSWCDARGILKVARTF